MMREKAVRCGCRDISTCLEMRWSDSWPIGPHISCHLEDRSVGGMTNENPAENVGRNGGEEGRTATTSRRRATRRIFSTKPDPRGPGHRKPESNWAFSGRQPVALAHAGRVMWMPYTISTLFTSLRG